ncbi:MAG: Small, acid-soluble spore protein H [Clostridia bacterium 62_21]|nr:MAG: Small, acid-soluble spore protein H [Clostridia bacterium 62_21]HAG07392.1 H-type small acid-soluble spore protein [Peptococcaceae bacterium]
MDFKRAQEIIKSDEIIDVLLNGSPVWIERLDTKNQTATVRPLNGRGNVLAVPVAELVEDR